MNYIKRFSAGLLFFPTMIIAFIPMMYYGIWYGRNSQNLIRAWNNPFSKPYMWAHCWLFLNGKREGQRW